MAPGSRSTSRRFRWTSARGKGDTFEGGMRVPGIFWWPGRVQPGIVTGPGSTLMCLRRRARWRRRRPSDRVMDSLDLGPALFDGRRARATWMFFTATRSYAIRSGPWKVSDAERVASRNRNARAAAAYQLDHDPGEQLLTMPGRIPR